MINRKKRLELVSGKSPESVMDTAPALGFRLISSLSAPRGLVTVRVVCASLGSQFAGCRNHLNTQAELPALAQSFLPISNDFSARSLKAVDIQVCIPFGCWLPEVQLEPACWW